MHVHGPDRFLMKKKISCDFKKVSKSRDSDFAKSKTYVFLHPKINISKQSIKMSRAISKIFKNRKSKHRFLHAI